MWVNHCVVTFGKNEERDLFRSGGSWAPAPPREENYGAPGLNPVLRSMEDAAFSETAPGLFGSLR
jgi:hypothetical protein